MVIWLGSGAFPLWGRAAARAGRMKAASLECMLMVDERGVSEFGLVVNGSGSGSGRLMLCDDQQRRGVKTIFILEVEDPRLVCNILLQISMVQSSSYPASECLHHGKRYEVS